MDYDWDQLQEEYIASMEKHENAERDLRNRVAKLLEVFTAVINLVAFIWYSLLDLHGVVGDNCYARWNQSFKKVGPPKSPKSSTQSLMLL